MYHPRSNITESQQIACKTQHDQVILDFMVFLNFGG